MKLQVINRNHRTIKFFGKFLFILIAGILMAQVTEMNPAMDHPQQLIQLEKEVRENLTGNILPYWTGRMIDTVNGGFYGRIDGNEKVYPDAGKGGILNARILWTFSSAFRILNDTAYLNTATRARDYILEHFIDKQYGGAYRSVDAKGRPDDTRKQIYTQAFFIYALAEYYRATGDLESLSKAKEIFELVEKNSFDYKLNGYFEVYSRDWKRLNDRLMEEKYDTDRKGMNTHLHLLEAYTNLYRVWPDEKVADRLRNLIEIFTDKIVNQQNFHLQIFFTREWVSTSSVQSYGHDIESSWLLVEAAHLLGDPVLLTNVQEISLRILTAASEGIQQDGSLIYERDSVTGHINTSRQWWPQAETVVGLVHAFELTGNKSYLDKALNCWNYTKQNLVDNEAGEWFGSVSESGEVNRRGDKAGFWKCPYHNGRMCLEIITRISE